MITVILLALFFQAFFSAAETAVLSCNKLSIRHKAGMGDRRAVFASALLDDMHRVIVTALAGTNICVVSASIIAAHMFIALYPDKGAFVSAVVMCPVVLFFGEILPKSVSRVMPEKTLFVIAPAVSLSQRILFPVVFLMEFVSGILLRVLGIRGARNDPFLTKADIEILVRQITREGVLEESEQEAIHQIFDFPYTRVGDIMVRLPDIKTVSYNDTRGHIIGKAAEYGFTRYPVIRGKRILGILNIYDLFYNEDEADWRKNIRPVRQVYAAQRIKEVFYSMKKNKELACAVVRRGRLIGFVTLADIMGQIELI